MSHETCVECDQPLRLCGCDNEANWKPGKKCRLCDREFVSFEEEELHDALDCAFRMKELLSAATARASELERALATETKAREMSWAHHDEHHERDQTRWVKMCQALGKLADDGSPAIAWPAIFELVAAMGERVARAELQLKALDLLCGYTSEEDGTVVFRVLDTGERHCQARIIPARGDTAGRAALALAVRLGLIAPDGKGE